MWITPAHAQAGGGGSDILTSMLPLILIFVVFYFLLIRPQQKRAREHREMLGAIRRGDRVVTGGGILGTVTRVKDDDELTVEIAEGVKVSIARGTIAQVLSKSDTAGGAGTGAGPTVVSGGGGARPGGLLGNLFGGGRR
jgi:preprotein translocase subunit YajC